MNPATKAPRGLAQLEERLSDPGPAAIRALQDVDGDIAVLGAGGKMGPSLVRMIARAAPDRRVVAVSRFRNAEAAKALRGEGVDVLTCDLEDRTSLAAIPDTRNIFFLAGQKFGTAADPGLTWTTNVVVPALVADRFPEARFVVLSTGNVYPLSPTDSGGSTEADEPRPLGEYAWSCLARERIFEHAARMRGTRVAIVRLNYAVDLRYGVLVDIAQKIMTGDAIDVTMGYVNVIWQGDACARIIQCLTLAAAPPFVLNVTGADVLPIRTAAARLGALLHRTPVLRGIEASDALLSNAARSHALFGPPSVDTDLLLEWVAEWISSGGTTLGRATHFEQRGGAF